MMNTLRNFLYAVLALLTAALGALSAEPPFDSVNWNDWSWTAPEPPLPNTEWYDYGWDSTSNGPTPADLGQRGARGIVPGTIRLASLNPPAPPLPPGLLAMADTGKKAEAPKPAAEAPAAKLTAPKPNVGKVYADTFLSLRTPDFNRGDYLYGIGVGYQVTKHWAFDVRASHHGLDAAGSAIQDLGGRLVARMPFEFLAPYTFLGGSFDLESDSWHLQPGGGIELGVSRSLKGLSVFAEGGLDADLKGRSGYLFTGGLRLRF